jgi:2-octaprenyl-6-methoxyphenol hydroxylase
MILIGNSAQIVHPVSAQGLNLGLRDVQVLSGILAKNNKVEITDIAIFDKLRDKDAAAVINFTHVLATKLESKNKIIEHLRGAGIIALSNMPPVQNFVARSLIFGI